MVTFGILRLSPNTTHAVLGVRKGFLMKLSYWFCSFGFFGLVAPLALLLLQRHGVTVSPFALMNVWPTFILAAIGALGKTGWWAWSFAILLNGICYGVFGAVTGIV